MESEAVNPAGNDVTSNVTSKRHFSRFPVSARRTSLRGRWTPFLVAALVLVPVGAVVSSFFAPATDIWQHLVETTLPGLLINTFWLVLGVAFGVLLLGVSLAWLTAVCEFPGRKFLSWALLLPLAVPAYVTAFVALGLFDYVGPVQTTLRGWLDSDLSWFPDIRSRTGVIIVMVLAFYPYVYLLARNAFLTQGKRSLEAAQSLGLSRAQGFFRVALPMARPWIAAGLMLALMETLADFGTVAVFNYDTFTTAIYRAWFGMFSLSAASQLASLLIVIVLAVIILEQQVRSRTRYAESRTGGRADRIPLAGGLAWLATGFSSFIFFLGFLLPAVQLSFWASDVFARDFDQRYLEFLWHSLLLSGVAALLICFVALLLAYATRRHPDPFTYAAVRVATVGYALPGAVLAVGIFIPIAWLDTELSDLAQQWFHIETGLIIQGTLVTMLLAYLVRFLAVGHGPLESAMQRITSSVDEAAMGLGLDSWGILRRVHLPMLRGGLFTAATLVFVDVMKEMPITLMTRPFGWDTLAVRVFELTSEGQWDQAALPSVTLVLAGLVPIAFFMRQADRLH